MKLILKHNVERKHNNNGKIHCKLYIILHFNILQIQKIFRSFSIFDEHQDKYELSIALMQYSHQGK